MATFDITDRLGHTSKVRLPSVKVAGGRLVFDVYKGTGRVRFYNQGISRHWTDRLSEWKLWLQAGDWSFKYLPPDVRSQFERASRVFRFWTPRDVYMSVASGRFFIEIEDVNGVKYHPIHLRPYKDYLE